MSVTNSAAQAAPSDEPKLPAHEVVYQKLRAQILFGELAPGQAVTIQGLTDSLEAGMTPVREAIRRLISDGALVFQGNRRVSVPLLRSEDIDELSYVRKSIESELARRAALRVSEEQIAQLEAIDIALDQAISTGDVAGYLVQNYSFHSELYAYADAPIMADLADRLWLRFGPSLRVVCGRFGTQSFPDRHKDIIEAMRRGAVEKVAQAMEKDVEQGMEQVSQGLGGTN
ncbi:GntR family transcriptional regulator [Phaeobacter sp. 11ANDIMAR09]|uniref:GntR family transcriptional regulator n=1 Tax=Phaeobacter sp. 11ANDIMAR09 TaxID=1225647 RepID=UPI000A442F31|nr:GntR family transcriptional regulator [Phaeobacter sp. 11ANDIMAR09]